MALSSAFGLIGCLQRPMTSISFRSFQLRMETGKEEGSRVKIPRVDRIRTSTKVCTPSHDE
jgi:hypothetical protein